MRARFINEIRKGTETATAALGIGRSKLLFIRDVERDLKSFVNYRTLDKQYDSESKFESGLYDIVAKKLHTGLNNIKAISLNSINHLNLKRLLLSILVEDGTKKYVEKISKEVYDFTDPNSIERSTVEYKGDRLVNVSLSVNLSRGVVVANYSFNSKEKTDKDYVYDDNLEYCEIYMTVN